jgi:hypothetical protein
MPFLSTPLKCIFMGAVLFKLNGNVENRGQRTCVNSCLTCKPPLKKNHSVSQRTRTKTLTPGPVWGRNCVLLICFLFIQAEITPPSDSRHSRLRLGSWNCRAGISTQSGSSLFARQLSDTALASWPSRSLYNLTAETGSNGPWEYLATLRKLSIPRMERNQEHTGACPTPQQEIPHNIPPF